MPEPHHHRALDIENGTFVRTPRAISLCHSAIGIEILQPDSPLLSKDAGPRAEMLLLRVHKSFSFSQ